jgi:hypothetical protein
MFRYLSWVEQAYPNGSDRQLESLLLRCVKGYLQLNPVPPEVKNSPVFLNICLKYVNLKTNPLPTFDFLETNGFFQEMGLFYESWAAVLEKQHKPTQCMEVYHLGINRKAEPLRRLERHLYQFMERESQRVKEQTEASSQHDGNDRTTLGDLKMSKKGRVGTIRTGAATTVVPGGLQHVARTKKKQAATSTNARHVQVYNDENGSVMRSTILPMNHFPGADSTLIKENVQNPRKWPEAKISGLKQKSVKPAFQAYKDPEENGSTNPPRVTNRLPPQSRVLKETKHPPVPSNPLSNEVYYHVRL